MIRVVVSLALGALALWLSACSTAHTARPLGQGNHALHLSVGGPVAGIGDPSLLVPLPTLTYKYGITDRLDLYGGWHVLETFLNDGNAYFDIGASYYVLEQDGAWPGVSAALTVSPLLNDHSGWVLIDLQATASWYIDAAETQLVYLGFHNGITPVRDRELRSPLYHWTPYVGWHGRFLSWMGAGVEVKWHRPYSNTTRSVAGYLAPANQGALAFLLGFTFYFERADLSGEEGT